MNLVNENMEINNPLVTVVVTCFNRCHTIKRAIESILQQTYSNIELIVVDDASTDNSVNLITENFPNIRLLRNSYNCGQNASLSLGFKNSSGSIFAYLDSDDWWDKRTLAVLVEYLVADPELGFVFCDVFDGKRTSVLPMHKYECKEKIAYKAALQNMGLGRSGTFLIKRTIMDPDRLFDDTGLKNYTQDNRIGLELSKSGAFMRIPEALLFTEVSHDAITRQFYRTALSLRELLEDYQVDLIDLCTPREILKINNEVCLKLLLSSHLKESFREIRKAMFFSKKSHNLLFQIGATLDILAKYIRQRLGLIWRDFIH